MRAGMAGSKSIMSPDLSAKRTLTGESPYQTHVLNTLGSTEETVLRGSNGSPIIQRPILMPRRKPKLRIYCDKSDSSDEDEIANRRNYETRRQTSPPQGAHTLDVPSGVRPGMAPPKGQFTINLMAMTSPIQQESQPCEPHHKGDRFQAIGNEGLDQKGLNK